MPVMSSALRQRWLHCAAVVMATAVLPGLCRRSLAEDRLVLTAPNSSSRVALRGEVLQVSAEFVEFRLAVNKEVRRYPVERVVEIVTPRVPQHAQAVSSMAQRRYSESVAPLQAALQRESRPWMRHTILAELIRCHLELGDDVAAAELFVSLIRSDPRLRNWALAPLRWAAAPMTPAEQDFARAALEGNVPALQLIAASWGLEHPRFAGSALRILEQLQQAEDDSVRTLARVQLWRRDLPTAVASDLRIARWEQQVRRIPLPLRRGPMLVIAAARRRRHENDLAAATWLWLPSAFPEPRRWAAEAVFHAAEALRDSGDIAAAARLLDELTSEYQETPAAQLAARELAKLREGAEQGGQGRDGNGR